MEEGAEVPACAETEGVTIFCCLYTGSPDCFRVLPVQEGEQILLLRPLQPGNRMVVRQQRGQVRVAPEVKGQGFKNEVEMAGEERFQQTERDFLFPREQHPVLLSAISFFHHDLPFFPIVQPLTSCFSESCALPSHDVEA